MGPRALNYDCVSFSKSSSYAFERCSGKQASPVQTSQWLGQRVLVMWVLISFPKELSPGKLPQGGGRIVNISRFPPGSQVPVIRISYIQPNMLLVDCKIIGVPVSAVVDCSSPICTLSNDEFSRISLGDTLGKVGSKVVGAEGSQLNNS